MVAIVIHKGEDCEKAQTELMNNQNHYTIKHGCKQ